MRRRVGSTPAFFRPFSRRVIADESTVRLLERVASAYRDAGWNVHYQETRDAGQPEEMEPEFSLSKPAGTP